MEDKSAEWLREEIDEYMKTLYNNEIFWLGRIMVAPISLTKWIRWYVYLLEIESGEKYVFKAYKKNKTNKIDFEIEALKQRRKEWIMTPESYRTWSLEIWHTKIFYSIAEFISPSYTIDQYNDNMIKEIAEIIGKMKNVTWKWFGPIKEIKEWEFIWIYKTYGDLLRADEYKIDDFKKMIRAEWQICDHKKVVDTIKWAKKTIKNSFNIEKKSTLLHTDLNPNNIIFTKPMTIIDPNVELWNEYEDLALCMLNVLCDNDLSDKEKQRLNIILIDIYEKTIKLKIDKSQLDACIVLRAIWRFMTRYTIFEEKNTDKTLKIIEDIGNLVCKIEE